MLDAVVRVSGAKGYKLKNPETRELWCGSWLVRASNKCELEMVIMLSRSVRQGMGIDAAHARVARGGAHGMASAQAGLGGRDGYLLGGLCSKQGETGVIVPTRLRCRWATS